MGSSMREAIPQAGFGTRTQYQYLEASEERHLSRIRYPLSVIYDWCQRCGDTQNIVPMIRCLSGMSQK